VVATAILFALALMATSSRAVAAQQGIVAGSVLQAGTFAPIEGAQVQVVGTGAGAITDAAGRFRIVGLSGEEVTLQVRRLGYTPLTQRARLGALDVRIVLAEATLRLDELVITGTAGAEQRRVIGNAVVAIDAARELERSAAPNLGSLLQSRAPGVIITPGSGRIGAGPTIQIRGRSSLSLSSEPIVYVDGVRVNNATGQGPPGSTAGGNSFGAQNSQVASRLNDINPEDIERIEIIKGPAAATIYGTEAANGVIQIVTKRGRTGRPQWTAKIEQGAVWFNDPEGRIPTNYFRDPTAPATSQPVAWNPIRQEEDRGTPIFSTGQTQSYHLGLSGGSPQTSYYLSGTFNNDEGIEPNNFGESFAGHGTISVAASDKLDIQTTLTYFRGTAHLGADGGLSPLLSIALGHPLQSAGHLANRGFAFAPVEVPQRLYDNVQDINRYTGGLTVSHRPTSWFTQRMILGLDFTSDDSRALERYAPPDLVPYFTAAIGGAQGAAGRIGQTLRANTFITGDYSGTGTFTLTPAISSASSIGLQVLRKQLKASSLSGIVFPAPGVETVSGTSTKGTPTHGVTVNTTVGGYAQQRFGWRDRVFLTGAVRVDNNSAFGDDFTWVAYPKLSATWVISEEPFWTRVADVVDGVKLRAAYGQSGQQPATFSALRTVTNAPRANGDAGVTPGSLGNSNLQPERGEEYEVGFEAGLFERLSLDVTYYNRRTKHAILQQEIAPSSGFAGTQTVNIGETSNRGLEVMASLQALTRENFAWEIGGNISTNKDRVEDRGGLPPGTGLFRDAEGYPIGGFWTKSIASADRNPTTHAITNVLCHNGPPTNGPPVPCAQALSVFVGTPTPKVLGALTNTFTIGSRLTLYGLVDFKRGHKLLNGNDANRCAANLCEARYFPERYSTEYLAAILPANVATVLEPFIQDASFVKLREVSASYRLPERWLARAGASRTTFVLAGRNLATWTDYTGLDPETRLAAAQDQGLIPNLRQLVASLHLAF
jgi:TonB-linked SusC/RagA family outer membrane protein